jgi:hypothetical protein
MKRRAIDGDRGGGCVHVNSEKSGALFEFDSKESTNARARESGWARVGCTRLEWLGARFKASSTSQEK